jgi:hypothetical protein
MKKNIDTEKIESGEEFSVTINKATDVNQATRKIADFTKPKVEAPEVITEKFEPNPEVIAHEPGSKQVYAYDQDGKFTGMATAHECPLEKGVFHLPAGTTEEPVPDKMEFPTFNPAKNKWVNVAPPKPTKEEKAEIKKDLAAEARAQRDYLLLKTDYTQVMDFAGNMAPWAAYRKELRDLPKQKGFPDKITWPEPPKKAQ